MPDYGSVFTGRYLASPDLGDREVTVKIAKVVAEMVEDEKKGPRKRWIAYFERADKGMLLNRSNSTIIAALCKSRMTEDWIGHSITIAALDVKFGAETVKGLRVVGSPELDRPTTVKIKLPKKKDIDWPLKPTGKKPAHADATAPAPKSWGHPGNGAPEPAAERTVGEDDNA